VLPLDAEVWYLAGLQELASGQPERAWQSWQRALEISQLFFQPILDRSRTVLDSQEILDKVLPEQASLVFAAANYLFPQADAPPRQPFLRKVVQLLNRSATPLTAAELHTKAQAQAGLDDVAGAVESYRAALQQQPRQTNWRLAMAHLLYR